MAISVFDIYKVGVGPSSSHTFGPMVAAARFLKELQHEQLFEATHQVRVELYGSLALTGKGHFTDLAIMLGLEGNAPDTLDSSSISRKQSRIQHDRTLHLGGQKFIPFDPTSDLLWHRTKVLPKHPNGMAFQAFAADGSLLKRAVYFSIGGGFVVGELESIHPKEAVGDKSIPFPYTTGEALAQQCAKQGKSISDVVLENELTWRSEQQVRQKLLHIAAVMEQSIKTGLQGEGEIPGGLKVRRLAKVVHEKVEAGTRGGELFQMADYLSVYALAVMELNASLGQVVTAPTMGSAGIVPAVLQAYKKFGREVTDDKICRFLLTSAGCAIPVKINASFSGAEVGCQGEVGSACLMAAAGLAEVIGGTVQQVLNSGAMALEHNLGLTCDPVGGLVQIPCIERNALAANKAVNAVRLCLLKGEARTKPTFDEVVRALYLTGKDMSDKYKETSQGGLAVVWTEC